MFDENVQHMDKPIKLYKLKAKNGLEVQILNYGARIQKIIVPTPNGKVDVALGFEDFKGYEEDGCYIGATVGPVANRIKEGKFSIGESHYQLPVNNGKNHLHGGPTGFHQKVWDEVKVWDDKLILSCSSREGEGGYPGALEVKVTYMLDGEGVFIKYSAKTSQDTIVNLTNHSYFNLDGGGTIEEHEINIKSDHISQTDSEGIPGGTLMNVEGTVFDFREGLKPLSQGLQSSDEEIADKGGYDHNYILPTPDGIRRVAQIYSNKSGIMMEVFTDQKCMQLYTGNYLEGIGKNQQEYGKYSGFCLETQNYPNGINVKEFDSSILKRQKQYQHNTRYTFRVE